LFLPLHAVVNDVVEDLKTEASRKPVSLDSALAEVLVEWRGRAPYSGDGEAAYTQVLMPTKRWHKDAW